MIMPAQAIIISDTDRFDTDCVLCSGMVHVVLRHERTPSAHRLRRDDLDREHLVIEDDWLTHLVLSDSKGVCAQTRRSELSPDCGSQT